jgi:hypothetical protein
LRRSRAIKIIMITKSELLSCCVKISTSAKLISLAAALINLSLHLA